MSVGAGGRRALRLPAAVAGGPREGHSDLLLTTSHDGVRVWDLGEASLRARVCALAGRGFTSDEWARSVGPALAFIATCEPAD